MRGPVTNAHNVGWRQPGKPTKQVISVEETQKAENEQCNVLEGAWHTHSTAAPSRSQGWSQVKDLGRESRACQGRGLDISKP